MSKTVEFIYKEADKQAELILERFYPLLKNALREAYAKGFLKASMISQEYMKKQNETKSDEQI